MASISRLPTTWCNAAPVCCAADALCDAAELCCDAAELCCDTAELCEDATEPVVARALVVPDAASVVLVLAADAVEEASSPVAVAVVVGSADTPVTVCTFPSGAVYTPEMALPLPPTSSW